MITGERIADCTDKKVIVKKSLRPVEGKENHVI